MSSHNLQYIAQGCGGAVRSGGGWLCRCPAHDDRKPSLSLLLGAGDKLLANCHAGCDFISIIGALKDRGLLDEENYHQADAPQPSQPDYSDYARQIWRSTMSADGTVVEKYLKSRSYTGNIPDSLRYHSALKHNPSGLTFPAMVAGIKIYPNPEVIAVHRTYLQHSGIGKAEVEPDKMRLGAASGGAVRFGPFAGDSLWLSEGIETGLSVFLATNQPTWATLSTSGMKGVVLPPPLLVPNLFIAADHDIPGIEAAQILAAREAAIGRNVQIIIPPTPGQDFNDLLREATYVT